MAVDVGGGVVGPAAGVPAGAIEEPVATELAGGAVCSIGEFGVDADDGVVARGVGIREMVDGTLVMIPGFLDT